MNNSERYKKAFSSLRTSDVFKLDTEDIRMVKKTSGMKKLMVAACTALAVLIGGTSVYASNLGGVQRMIQVWVHGDQTEAVITLDGEKGQYTITDKDGKMIQGGGGIAFESNGNSRPLTAEEMAEHIENEVTTDRIDGKLYLMYKAQKVDITDKLNNSDYCFITIKDKTGDIYCTVTKNGGVASSRIRYIQPNEFRTE